MAVFGSSEASVGSGWQVRMTWRWRGFEADGISCRLEDAIVVSAANVIVSANQPQSVRGSEPAVKVAAMDAHDATLALLDTRARDATICPSEVARALAASVDGGGAERDWRGNMPAVHAAVDRLLLEGRVRLSWQGRMLPSRSGPYRIGRRHRD